MNNNKKIYNELLADLKEMQEIEDNIIFFKVDEKSQTKNLINIIESEGIPNSKNIPEVKNIYDELYHLNLVDEVYTEILNEQEVKKNIEYKKKINSLSLLQKIMIALK